jgi:hypothetical protein
MAQKYLRIIVLLTAAALLAAVLCSCAASNKGQKLAKDLIAAGFKPMEPFQPRSDDKTKTGPYDKGSMIVYDNGGFTLDEQGRVKMMVAYASRPSYMKDKLSPIHPQTYKGTDMFSLTKKEILSLYGYQKQANAYSKGSVLHYEFRLGSAGMVRVAISLSGSGDSDKVRGIYASYRSDESTMRLLNEGNSADFYDWPTMN